MNVLFISPWWFPTDAVSVEYTLLIGHLSAKGPGKGRHMCLGLLSLSVLSTWARKPLISLCRALNRQLLPATQVPAFPMPGSLRPCSSSSLNSLPGAIPSEKEGTLITASLRKSMQMKQVGVFWWRAVHYNSWRYLIVWNSRSFIHPPNFSLPLTGRNVYMGHTQFLEPLEDMNKCD